MSMTKDQTMATERRTLEKTLEPLGKGAWMDGEYALATCPFCTEKYTMRFLGGTGIWRCISCEEHGETFKELENRLRIRFVTDAKILGPDNPVGAIVVSEYVKPTTFVSVDTGLLKLDQMLGGLQEGTLSILTGKQGEGKSTFSGQLALNAIDQGKGVCFYSGELSAPAFIEWIHSQAAGLDYSEMYIDKYGKERHEASKAVVPVINEWIGKKLILYDNTIVGASEAASILKLFHDVRNMFGCQLYIVDNLMTVSQARGRGIDYSTMQSMFVGELIAFAQQARAHVILVAHPRKGEEGDYNERVSGLLEITNRSSNVMYIERLTKEEYQKMQRSGELESPTTTNLLHVSKNRRYGETGTIELTFDKYSRRFTPSLDPRYVRYGWERLLKGEWK